MQQNAAKQPTPQRHANLITSHPSLILKSLQPLRHSPIHELRAHTHLLGLLLLLLFLLGNHAGRDAADSHTARAILHCVGAAVVEHGVVLRDAVLALALAAVLLLDGARLAGLRVDRRQALLGGVVFRGAGRRAVRAA